MIFIFQETHSMVFFWNYFMQYFAWDIVSKEVEAQNTFYTIQTHLFILNTENII